MKNLPQVPHGRFYKQPDGSVISEAEHLARQAMAAARPEKPAKGGKAKAAAEPAADESTTPQTTPETTPEDGE